MARDEEEEAPPGAEAEEDILRRGDYEARVYLFLWGNERF